MVRLLKADVYAEDCMYDAKDHAVDEMADSWSMSEESSREVSGYVRVVAIIRSRRKEPLAFFGTLNGNFALQGILPFIEPQILKFDLSSIPRCSRWV